MARGGFDVWSLCNIAAIYWRLAGQARLVQARRLSPGRRAVIVPSTNNVAFLSKVDRSEVRFDAL